jgi:outer membrane lipoprotein carrier protein
LILLPFALLFQAPSDLSRLLTMVERRYNGATTLQMRFEQQYRGGGQPSRTENGILFLKKPGRMRWEYRHPEGKLFLTDGKDAWFYSPAMNQVEKSPIKATDDLRAPLAFLMGRLDFNRDFRGFQSEREGELVRVTGVPKSAKSPYREVEFWVSPAGELREVRVVSQEGARMQFRFSDERLAVPLNEELFRFRVPAGAEVVARP